MRAMILERIKKSDETKVDLTNLDIVDVEIKEIIDRILTIRPHVRSIILRNNQISDKGAYLLEENLANLSNLLFIDLQFNNITLEGAESILKLRSIHPQLKAAFHGNMISDVSELYDIEQKYARPY